MKQIVNVLLCKGYSVRASFQLLGPVFQERKPRLTHYWVTRRECTYLLSRVQVLAFFISTVRVASGIGPAASRMSIIENSAFYIHEYKYQTDRFNNNGAISTCFMCYFHTLWKDCFCCGLKRRSAKFPNFNDTATKT